VVVGQALPDKVLAPIGYAGLLRESHFASIEDGLISHDSHLGLIVTEWLHTEQELVEDYPHTPDINLDR